MLFDVLSIFFLFSNHKKERRADVMHSHYGRGTELEKVLAVAVENRESKEDVTEKIHINATVHGSLNNSRSGRRHLKLAIVASGTERAHRHHYLSSYQLLERT